MKNTTTILFFLLVLVIAAFVAPTGCTQPDDTRRVLAAQGYSEIEITGWRPFAKSEKDVFSTGFRAKSPGGSTVTGAVTAGWFKGFTVRLD